MKKLYLKILLGITVTIFIITYIIDPFFDKENSFFKGSINEVYNTKTDSIDILIFGSSHALNSYNPKVIDKTLNTTTFNLASASQRLNTTKFLIEDITHEFNPKIVVLDLFYFSVKDAIEKKDKDFQLIVYNNTRNSINKLNTVHSYYDLKDVIPVLSSTIRNHNKWHEIFIDKKEKNRIGKIRGFVPLYNIISEKERNRYKDFYTKKHNSHPIKSTFKNLSENEINRILEINTFLEKRNIQLILVSAPYFRYFYGNENIKFHSLLNHLSDSLNVNYLDYNAHFDKLNLDFKDFNDQNHVNISGSNKLSAYLSKYISNNSNFEIKNNAYIKEYLDSIKPRTLIDIENRINKEESSPIDYIIEEGIYVKTGHKFTEEIKNKGIIL